MDQGRWPALLAHRERLLLLARSRGVSAEDAEDVVQEAMLRCAEFDRLDVDRLPQFLTTVTLRLCADVHRRHKEPQRAKRWLAPLLHDEPDPADVVCRDHGSDWVAALVGGLPEKQRHVIVDRARGLSIQQIATRHRLTYKAAESALARARAALRSAVATSWSVAAFVTRRTRGCDVPVTASAAAFVVAAALVGTAPSMPGRETDVPAAVALPASSRPPGATPDPARPAPRSPGRDPSPTPYLTPPPVTVGASPGSGWHDPVPDWGTTVGPLVISHSPEDATYVERIQNCLANGFETSPGIGCRTPEPNDGRKP